MAQEMMEIQANVIIWVGVELHLVTCKAALPNVSGVNETWQSWAVDSGKRKILGKLP